MCNIRDVHLKIKEISGKNSNGRPHIYTKDVGSVLNIPGKELDAFLDVLYSVGFVSFYKGCKQVVSLTAAGMAGEIPLAAAR